MHKGKNGQYLTQGLFYEWNNPDAIYTLRDSDSELWTNRSGKVYKSFPAIYRRCVDEYDAAMELLGSWDHWQYLIKQCDWFVNGLQNTKGVQVGTSLVEMRAEMERRDQSKAKRVLMEKVEDGDLNAAKYLYDKTTKTKSVGRPEKKKPAKSPSAVASIYDKIKER